MNTARPDRRDREGQIFALGFGATVVMWVIGYVSRLPPAWLPSPVVVILLLACVFAAGWVAGRHTTGGWRAGAGVGLLASVLNMLILGSLLGAETPGWVRPAVILWVPGTLLAGALEGAVGALTGSAARRRAGEPAGGWIPAGSPVTPDWTAAFASVGAVATFCLLVIGGMVTSRSAGLDVPDWPTSFGYNMFLYPLSRMSGGIYLEHSHRLFGSLVGLTTLVLAIHLWRVEARRGVRLLAVGALVLVIVQGMLGGFRVTTAVTQTATPAVSVGQTAMGAQAPAAGQTAIGAQAAAGQGVTAAAETGWSLALRVLHGVTGQLFFAAMVALAAITSARWKSRRRPTVGISAPTDHGLTALLTASIMAQLVLGAIQRHLGKGLFIHITMATVVLVVAVVTGARAAGLDHGQPVLKRLGKAILWLVSGQVLLGIAALVVKGMAGGQLPAPLYKVVVTTAHQALGAILLGASVLLTVWSRRLLAAGEPTGR